MLLPSLFELFCSYNCDGPTAMVLRRGKNVSVHTTAMANCDAFTEDAKARSTYRRGQAHRSGYLILKEINQVSI
uniref:Uncharacterized protein n=1 Tax=Picea glauca TaxID=3330 RepID=A0A117NGY3_PICGL|nr:hypothetical protein ABT39_MTgene5694 [Picea glauca]